MDQKIKGALKNTPIGQEASGTADGIKKEGRADLNVLDLLPIRGGQATGTVVAARTASSGEIEAAANAELRKLHPKGDISPGEAIHRKTNPTVDLHGKHVTVDGGAERGEGTE